MALIAVIDDEKRQREILKAILEDEGWDVCMASSAEEGLKLISEASPDVVLTDLKMTGMDGIGLLETVMKKPLTPGLATPLTPGSHFAHLASWRDPLFAPPVIIMTAYGTIYSAVDAMKKGAFDYLTKPLEKDGIVMTVRKAVEKVELLRENIRLKDALYDKFKIDGIVGTSKKMQIVINTVKKVCNASVTVLIYGESGTGKELVARAIHYNSPRCTGPLTAVNCAAIPENLIESELFGYEQGAFTGASHRKAGLFESSDKGTIFLDEVGDLPPLTQTKILRVLQDKEIRRVGGKDNVKLDVRIIAATNKDLQREVDEGRFREDLYYRLKVVTVELPPLRERKEDIPQLVNYFIEKYCKEFGRRIHKISDAAIRSLIDYHWPGNIRHIESVIARAVLMAEEETIDLADIRDELRLRGAKASADIDMPDEGINFEEVEKEFIKKAMLKSNNVVAKAARLLGMSYKTLCYRLEKFGLSPSSKEE
jgi:DNA-binding NtrC family response regulator